VGFEPCNPQLSEQTRKHRAIGDSKKNAYVFETQSGARLIRLDKQYKFTGYKLISRGREIDGCGGMKFAVGDWGAPCGTDMRLKSKRTREGCEEIEMDNERNSQREPQEKCLWCGNQNYSVSP
jgi:hypothetical protein